MEEQEWGIIVGVPVEVHLVVRAGDEAEATRAAEQVANRLHIDLKDLTTEHGKILDIEVEVEDAEAVSWDLLED